jgi:hypothetical protein
MYAFSISLSMVGRSTGSVTIGGGVVRPSSVAETTLSFAGTLAGDVDEDAQAASAPSREVMPLPIGRSGGGL